MQALRSVIHSESKSDIRYWIALAQLPDVGPVRAKSLLSMFGILLGLELKGAVKQLTGKRFYLA